MPREVKAFSGTVYSTVATTIYTVPAGRVAKIILDKLDFQQGFMLAFTQANKPIYPPTTVPVLGSGVPYPMDADLGVCGANGGSSIGLVKKNIYLVAGESVVGTIDPGYFVQGSYRFVAIEEY